MLLNSIGLRDEKVGGAPTMMNASEDAKERVTER